MTIKAMHGFLASSPLYFEIYSSILTKQKYLLTQQDYLLKAWCHYSQP